MATTEPYQPDDYARHFKARWEALAEEQLLEQRREEEQEHKAMLLMQAGVVLIPSDHLKDNEFVVSRGIYEAAKRLL